jgi:hypothetical protein
LFLKYFGAIVWAERCTLADNAHAHVAGRALHSILRFERQPVFFARLLTPALSLELACFCIYMHHPHPRTRSVSNPRVRAVARLGIARLLASTHATLHRAVSVPANGYGASAAAVAAVIALHAPRDVAAVLDCGGGGGGGGGGG